MIPEPRFSVIIPVRNGESYIAQAIESVLAQTYPKFNLMILENKSTDRTVEIIQSYVDPRIIIIPSASSLSIEENWGRIIEQSMNEYITFMGHDDLLHPDFLAEIVALITSEPKASLYQVQYEEIDSLGNLVHHPATVAYKETAGQFLAAYMALKSREEVCGTGYVTRADDYRRVGGIPAFPGLLYADLVLWYRLTNLSYKVCSPKTLASYRIHPQGMHTIANFSNFYIATRQFYDFLCTTSELIDQPTVAYNYTNYLLKHSYRRAVVYAILSPDEGRAQLQMAKQHAAKDGLFTLHDRAARIYEVIIAMPHWLRHVTLLPIIWRRALRGFLANR